MSKVSIIIASRNEPYLKKTIDDICEKATGDIEVIVILESEWDVNNEYSNDKRVSYLFNPVPLGLREAVNQGVALSRGDYIMKCDAHVMFKQGFDEQLVKDCKEQQVLVPARYPLDPEKWEIEKRNDNKYPICYEYLVYGDEGRGLHSRNWHAKNRSEEQTPFDATPSAQGSCWFMHKKYFHELDLFEKKYGMFYLEFQEIALKSWLYGDGVWVDKHTWYAHWHKPKSHGRGYQLPGDERQISIKAMNKWLTNNAWKKQKRPFKWLIERFPDMPGWDEWLKNN